VDSSKIEAKVDTWRARDKAIVDGSMEITRRQKIMTRIVLSPHSGCLLQGSSPGKVKELGLLEKLKRSSRFLWRH
jgi:hypothetical protein